MSNNENEKEEEGYKSLVSLVEHPLACRRLWGDHGGPALIITINNQLK